MAKADLIVEVKIGTAIGEVHEPTPKTILEADVLQVFKGETAETLTFFQNGTEAIRVNEQPLLQAGDVYTVFLKETVNSVEAEYLILVEETSLYKVDGDKIIKWALPDEELDDITLETTVHKKSGQYQQHLDKESFYTLLTEKVSEQDEDN
ncbi:hypothetical protein JCM19046_2921 [Bacillus sp. JCM 19046]|nr:hypothetical protein JCM19045_496 [Bacillus sp. JCM 19045]GAF18350.1 hypothetical protein JCM19046_2921 [Bacillus sp. JCM 19046]